MGFSIHSNPTSLGIQRRLAETTRLLERHYARLASGQRIATAADDPAGLGMAERLDVELRSLRVARRNTLDGISLLQVGEGALGEFGEVLKRIRELALRASNGPLTDEDRGALEDERARLAEEAARALEATRFQGLDLFGGDGAASSVEIQVGTTEGATLTIELPDVSRVTEVLGNLNLRAPGQARRALEVVDLAIDAVAGARGVLGADQRRLEAALRSLGVREEATAAAHSRIADADMALELAERTRLEILQSAGISVLAQANVQPAMALGLLQSSFGRLA